MKVAFWNVNMGSGSSRARHDAFAAWCAWAQPDLLMLEELSATLVNSPIEQLSGMEQIDYVNTLDKNFESSTKCLCALTHTGDRGNFSARSLRFPGLDARRNLLKVTHPDAEMIVWGIHANASERGGREAVRAVQRHLGSLAGVNDVVGGDFNCAIDDRHNPLHSSHPLAWDGTALRFTQWNKMGANNITTLPLMQACHVTAALYTTIAPHEVIDYVTCGANRTAVALNSCQNEAMWRDILVQFDHCPVMYTIT